MIAAVPLWLERALGVPRAEAGQGSAWSIEFAWPWSGAAGWLICACAILFVAYCYRREAPLAGRAYRITLAAIRIAILAMVVLMLGELSIAVTRTGLPTVVLMIDDSKSMGEIDTRLEPKLRERAAAIVEESGLTEPTRLNLAKALAVIDGGFFRKFSREYAVRTYFTSETTHAATRDVQDQLDEIHALQPSGAATRLGDGLRRVLNDHRGAPPAAIVLFSDGVNTAGEPLAAASAEARLAGVPVFCVGLGDPRPQRDVGISDVSASDVAFAGDLVPFTVSLTTKGMKDETARVILREKGKDAALATAEVKIDEDGARQTVIHFAPPEEGEFEYTIEASPADDEADTTNNQASRRISVRNQLLRVLLVQAYPSFEFRFLKHLLERSTLGNDKTRKAFELKTVLQEADVEYAEQDESALRIFPVDRAELFKFDCVVFGDVNPGLLTKANLEDLRDFVGVEGGGMAMIAGPRYTPLQYAGTAIEPLIPVHAAEASLPEGETIEEGFRVRPTALGLTLPGMQLGGNAEETRGAWADLPELYWLLEARSLKPAARVLAEHPVKQGPDGKNLPVFVMQYVGTGEVLMHLTDETRLWRQKDEELFSRYWIQTIRYLSRSRLTGGERGIAFSTDQKEYQPGEPVRFTARFRSERDAPAENDGVQITIEHASAADEQLRLRRRGIEHGVFEGEVSALSPGEYYAWVDLPPAEERARGVAFKVLPPSDELSRLDMDVEALSQTAETTGGKFYTFDKASALANDLPRGRQAPIESLPPLSLWDRWPMFLVVLSLLIAEWVLRKRRGML